MKMKLVRGTGNSKSVEGKLYIDDVFECYTLEDTDRRLESGGTKIQNATAIPRGKYPVTWTMSTRFKKPMPLLIGVPQFSGVRIHAGNSSKDTEGCIIVGAVNASDKDDWVSSSKVAVDRLYPKIKHAIDTKEDITLEIV